ncbi:MAG: alkane 1-monooxygenase, partial [Rhizobiales bacterium]|nr:alkane 1-monooxygenase [Hyphomicrobiales bacterium]
PMEKAQVAQMLACTIVGGLDTVRANVASLIEQTAADELMIVSDVFDHTARLHSYELIAQATR